MNYLQVLFILSIAMSFVSGAAAAAAAANIRRDGELSNHLDAKASTELNPQNNFMSYPKLIPETVQHGTETTVELTCEVMASPAPSIRWWKNNQPLEENNIESNVILQSSQTSLARVRSTLLVTKPSRNLEDKYTCVMTSGTITKRLSSTVYTVDLNIDTRADYHRHVTVSKPRIVYSHMVYMNNIGSNVVIPCKSQGHPHPHVTWTDNNGKMVLRTNQRMRVIKTGELLITNLRWADMGDYFCNVSNHLGKDSSKTFVYPLKPQ